MCLYINIYHIYIYIYDRDASPTDLLNIQKKNNSLTNYENLHKILIFLYIYINFFFSLFIIQISINLRNIYYILYRYFCYAIY